MKARPVKIENDIVYVPLSRNGKQEAKIFFDDYELLLKLGVYPNWQMRAGNVSARVPYAKYALIGRILLNLGPGEVLRYRDKDHTNLLRNNLYKVEGWSYSNARDSCFKLGEIE